MNDFPSTVIACEHRNLELQREKEAHIENKASIQARLCEINAKCSSRLPNHQFQSLMKERSGLVYTATQVDSKLRSIGVELHALTLHRDGLKRQEKREASELAGDAKATEQRSEVEALVLLRSYYQEFAADKSRVGSMRQMAAEFVLKLNPIIRRMVNPSQP